MKTSTKRLLGLALMAATVSFAANAFAGGEDLRVLFELSKREALRANEQPQTPKVESQREFELRIGERALTATRRPLKDKRVNGEMPGSYKQGLFTSTIAMKIYECDFVANGPTDGTCVAVLKMADQVCEVTMKSFNLGLSRSAVLYSNNADSAECVTAVK